MGDRNSNEKMNETPESGEFRCFECNRIYNDKESFKTLGTDGHIWVGICWHCAERRGAARPRNKKNARSFEREYLDWGIRFLNIDAWIAGFGVIRDISKGGLSFFTDIKMDNGSLLDIEVRSINNRLVLKEKAKVLRVKESEEGYEVGVMFVIDASEDTLRNKRKHQRYNVDFLVEFRTDLVDKPSIGKVIDLSQGGVRFLSMRKLETGQRIILVVDTRKKAVSQEDLSARPKAIRRVANIISVRRKKNYYEVRASFTTAASFIE